MPQEMPAMDNKTLTALFRAVGSRYGYDDITAEFAAFRDFKIRWSRTYRWASFEVSDYLSDAPDEVITSLADTLFAKIKGERDTEYSDEVCGWLTSDDFVRSKQPMFIRRYRGLSRSSQGDERDLMESYDRLVSAGLVERDPDLFLGWAVKSKPGTVGKSSILMKVVAMSDVLDSIDVPDDLMDYSLYSQVAHVGMGFTAHGNRRGKEYDEILSRFPDRPRIEADLRRMGMHI